MSHSYADLHIHSYYSDGTMSPHEILNIAVEKDIGLLAITDHDILEGSIELIACGSDCHGSFEETEIGEMNIPIEELCLGELY